MSLIKRRLLGAVLLIAALVLSGCGAVVDTVLELRSDGGGQRVMKVSLPTETFDNYVDQDLDSFNQQTATDLPVGMTFSGFTRQSDVIEATFTVPFSSPDDYRAKIDGILSSTDVPSPAVEFSVDDTPFRSMLTIRESFSSSDLLHWLDPQLNTAARLQVEEEFFSDGRSAVDFNGELHDTDTPIHFEGDTQAGSITAETSTVAEDDKWRRTITVTMPNHWYQDHQDAIDRYFGERGYPTAMANRGSAVVVTISLPALPAEEIGPATAQILGGTSTFATSIEPHSLIGETLTIADQSQCAYVCGDPTSIVPASVQPLSHWQPQQSQAVPESGKVTVTHLPTVDMVTVDTSFTLNGNVTQAITLSLPELRADEFNAMRKRIAAVVSPGTSISMRDQQLTVRFTGDDGEALQESIREVFPDSSVTLRNAGSVMFDVWVLDQKLDFTAVVGSTRITTKVNTPALHRVDEDYQDLDGAETSVLRNAVTVQGPSLVAMVVSGALIMLAVGSGTAAVKLWRRIGGHSAFSEASTEAEPREWPQEKVG